MYIYVCVYVSKLTFIYSSLTHFNLSHWDEVLREEVNKVKEQVEGILNIVSHLFKTVPPAPVCPSQVLMLLQVDWLFVLQRVRGKLCDNNS